MKKIFSLFDLTKQNQELVFVLAKQQADRIFCSDNRGRTLEEIYGKCMMSTPAELFMSQKPGWKMSTHDHYDCVDENNQYVEIKAYQNIFSVERSKLCQSKIKNLELQAKDWFKAYRVLFFRFEPDDLEPSNLFKATWYYIGLHKIMRNENVFAEA